MKYSMMKYFSSVLFVTGPLVSHWSRSWSLGQIPQIHLRPPSSLCAYMMITGPWSPSLDLILTSVHSFILDLPISRGLTQWSGSLGGPDGLSQVSPACLGLMRLSLSYQGPCPALIAFWVTTSWRTAGFFCSLAWVWQSVVQLCTTLFDHHVSYLLLNTLKDKIKTDVFAVQTSWTRGKKKKQIESKMKAWLNGSSNIIKKAKGCKSEGEN